MPSVAVKLYSVFFKLLLKHRHHSRIRGPEDPAPTLPIPFGVTCRPEESVAATNLAFSSPDGVATKDIHIDPLTSLCVRIFLPDSSLLSDPPAAGASSPSRNHPPPRSQGARSVSNPEDNGAADVSRRGSYGGNSVALAADTPDYRRSSYDGSEMKLDVGDVYGGYLPTLDGNGTGGGVGHLVSCRSTYLQCDGDSGGVQAGAREQIPGDIRRWVHGAQVASQIGKPHRM